MNGLEYLFVDYYYFLIFKLLCLPKKSTNTLIWKTTNYIEDDFYTINEDDLYILTCRTGECLFNPAELLVNARLKYTDLF